MIAALACFTALAIPQAESPLSVMTFNVRYGTANDGENRWELRKPRVTEFLKNRRPELIGVQEALDFQIEDMKSVLPGYQSVGAGRDDGKAAGEYSAIIYDPSRLRLLRSDTFWLSDTPSVVASKHWGNNITRICTWAYFFDLKAKKYFYHFNTHLDHQSQPSREKAVALILSRIAAVQPKSPVLFTGDFNAGESNPVVKQVTDAGFRDTFRVLHADQKEVGTFNGFDKLGTDKIDFVFADASWMVRTADRALDKVGGFWVSDHLPVVAEVVLGA